MVLHIIHILVHNLITVCYQCKMLKKVARNRGIQHFSEKV